MEPTDTERLKASRLQEEPADDDEIREERLDALTGRQMLEREFSKDYDRILYSTAFRRLGGVTQVVTANEVGLFHNRLTHTLKTAQVGTRLANFLIRRHQGRDGTLPEQIQKHGGLDPRVVRAACMAHDLGHPPFGHIAEEEFQEVTQQQSGYRHTRVPEDYHLPDRFEGNAQSFRIVTKLAFRERPTGDGNSPALNLTRGTLAALMKYPWPYDRKLRPKHAPQNKKWGYFDSESDIARTVFEFVEGGVTERAYQAGGKTRYIHQTLEAQVMDWADDISYAVHDVEDFFRVGLVPLDQLRSFDPEWDAFFEYAWAKVLSEHKFVSAQRQFVENELEAVRKLFPHKPYEGYGADREDLHHFASTIIRSGTSGTWIAPNGVLVRNEKQYARIEILKQLTWYYVIHRPSLQSVQVGQRALIRRLYTELIEWVAEDWQGPGSGTPSRTGDRAKRRLRTRRQLPARLLSYLDVAFQCDPPAEEYGQTQRISRAVIDYMVSLTEVQAIELHARLSGGSVGSMFDTWIHV